MVFQNGQTIGSFTISGGTGVYSSNNPNVLNIEINPSITIEDGDTYTLFSMPQGEEIQLGEINLSSECFTANGEQVLDIETNQNTYQIVFNLDDASCSFYAGASKFGAMPVLAVGNFV